MIGAVGQGSLAVIVAKVDEQRASGLSASDGSDMKARHLALIREAGRAAIEETLLSPTRDDSEKLSEMSAEALAAEWMAYAEVYGSNGLAAGGGRSSQRPEVTDDRLAAATAAVAAPAAELPPRLGAYLAAALVLVLVVGVVQRVRVRV